MPRHPVAASCLALLALAGTGCDCGESSPPPDGQDGGAQTVPDIVVVTGVVVDEADLPVAGAQVTMAAAAATVDVRGRFHLEVPPNAASIVRASATGYASAERKIDLSGRTRWISTGPMILAHVGAQAVIDPANGGAVTDPTSGLSVRVPPGAFPRAVNVEVTALSLDDPFFAERRLPAPLPKPARGHVAPLFAIVVNAEGLQPQKPLGVSLPAPPAFPSGGQVPVGRFDPEAGAWVDAGLAVVVGNTLTFDITHLSTFAAALPAVPVAGSAAPEIDGLDRVPSTFLPGEPRVDPRSGALQVGVQLPPLTRRNEKVGLTLFFDSRTPLPQIALPTAVPDAGPGEELFARASSPLGEVAVSGHVTAEVTTESPAVVTAVQRAESPDAGATEQAPGAEELPTGTYPAAVEVSRLAQATLFQSASGSFIRPEAGAPMMDASAQPVPAPRPIPLSTLMARPVAVDNRAKSPFGPGWHLKGLTRLVQPWCDPTQVTLAGDFEVPARTFGPSLELYASRIDDSLVAAGIARNELAGAKLAFAGGALYVGIEGRRQVWRVSLDTGAAELFAGGGTQATPAPCSGAGTSLYFGSIVDLFADPLGADLLVATDNCLIRLASNGAATKVMGRDSTTVQSLPPADGALASAVDFANDLQRVAGGLKEDLTVVQTWNHGAWLVESGVLRPFHVRATSPHGVDVAVDATGAILYGASFSPCMYRWVDGLVDPELFPACLGGFPTDRFDGPRETATVGMTQGLGFDASGNLWMLDTTFNAVRKLGTDGQVTTMTSGTRVGVSGLGGPARDASVGTLYTLGVHGAGDVAVGGAEGLFRLGPPLGRPLRTLGAGDGSLLKHQDDGSWLRTLVDGTRETYDERGLLVSRGRPGAAPMTYRYGNWTVEKEQDRCGRPQPPPLVQSIALGGSDLFTFEWNVDKLAAVSDPGGRRTSIAWNADRVGGISSTGADEVQFNYDDGGRIVRKTSRGPAGSLATFTYTYQDGRIASVDVPGRGLRNFRSEAQATAPSPSAVNAAGNAKNVDIGPAKATLDTRSGGQAVLTTQTSGLKVANTAGQATEMEFDSLGRLTKTTRPDGTTISIVRDALGRIVELTNVQTGDRWQYAYDSSSEQIAQRIDPANRVTQFLYDVQGRLVSRIAGGASTQFAYSTSGAAEGLPTRRTDGLGRETQVEYDRDGNLAKITDPAGLVTLIERDSAGRAVKVTEPSGLVHETSFDARDGETRQILGELADGRVLTMTRVVTDGWEEVGSHVPPSALASALDAEGRSWTYDRDAAFQVTRETTPGEGTVLTAFDELGRRTRRETGDGSVETFTYDASGRMVRRAFTQGLGQGADLRITYDELGRVMKLEDAQVVEGRTFAPGIGWTTLDVRAASGPGTPADFRMTRSRPSSAVTSETVAGVTVLVQRDFDERVSRVDLDRGSGGTTALWSATFNAARQVESIARGNGTSTRFTYDAAGRVVKQEELSGAGTLTLTWTYDAGGRPATRTIAGGSTRTYAYDAAGRLASCSDTGEAFGYDRNGARASSSGRTITRDSQGRLTSDGVYDYAYDAVGRRTNRTSKTDSSDRMVYQWGAGGLLSEVYRGATSTSILVGKYVWDGSGRRVRRTAGSDTWYYGYLPDTDRVVRVRDPLGTEWHVVHATPAAAWTVATTSGGAVRFAHLDPFDRVIGFSDEVGSLQVVEEDCYGGRLSGSPPFGPSVGFHGMPFDVETGLYFAGPRPYDPAAGEFLSADPKGLDGGADPWGYGGGNPVISADPSGRLFFVLIGALIAGAAIVNEIRSFSQSAEVQRTRDSYQAMTDVDKDDRLAEAQQAHQNLTQAAKKGGETAVKCTKKAIEAVTNPTQNAEDLADQVQDAVEDAAGGGD